MFELLTSKDKERFWRNVDIPKDEGCWLWRASSHVRGYGYFMKGYKLFRANRVSWEIYNRETIPTGMNVLHSCDNPRCINPDHLFLGTQKDNLIDASIKGRFNHILRTHCHRGHEFTKENTIFKKRKGGRIDRFCRACQNESNKRYARRKNNGQK